MKKALIAGAVIAALLTGCGYQDKPTNDDLIKREAVTILTKYFLIYGTPGDWERMEPITDEEVKTIQEYLQGMVEKEYEREATVTQTIYGR